MMKSVGWAPLRWCPTYLAYVPCKKPRSQPCSVNMQADPTSVTSLPSHGRDLPSCLILPYTPARA
jgi:hypothetical protein